MSIKMNDAKTWLKSMRDAAGQGGFSFSDWFLIEAHCFYCACRQFSEYKIVHLLTHSESAPHIVVNNNPTAKPMTFKIVVVDRDELIPKAQRECELILLASPLALPIPKDAPPKPMIISAWREGSPYPQNPNAPPCAKNPYQPPCTLKKSRRPRGQI